MKRFFRLASIITLMLGSAMPAVVIAQDAPSSEDWVVQRAPDQNAIVAVAAFDNGITLVARCSSNVFDLILTGLPEASGSKDSRQLILVGDDDTEERPTAWTVGKDRTVAFSRIPAMLARELADGGPLQIIVPSESGGRRTRYVMSLTPSGSAIEDTLHHCGRPLVDPRDDVLEGDGDGLPNGISWGRMPRGTFPETALGQPQKGYVTLSCLIGPEGRPQDCQVESEQPPGFLLGRAVLRSVGPARLVQSDEARAAGRPFEGLMIVFTTNFELR